MALNTHLETIEGLEGDELEAFERETKALFDALHTAIVQFGKEQTQSCLCVVLQGTRGLVHRVGFALGEGESEEA